jgi:SAM-dependent methyltransferase
MSNQPPCPLCAAPTERVYEHPETELRRCGSCDHCFADLSTLVERVTYSESYGDEEHTNWFDNPNIPLFDRIQRSLEAQGVTSVVDLGCGRAAFLQHLRRDHAEWRLVGLEQTPFEPPAGIEIHTGDLHQDLGETFDAVVSLAVIEHVDDPLVFLEQAMAKCRPGGTIVIMTLNDRSVLYATARLLRSMGLKGPFVQLYSSHHLHHFNKRSLAAAAGAVGLPVVGRHDHNIPAAAVDFAPAGRVADAVRLTGVRGTFLLGALTRRCYLQTIFCRLPDGH